ncbi:traG [Symbiodinium microadriaticum]|nr:traG [Symbiodinium microadriaticum]
MLASTALSYDPEHPAGKILMGAIGDKLIGIEDNRHILTVAGSRAGKSVTVIGNLCFYPGSVLATDPKGELANLTAARRAALGQKVYVLDPFGQTKGAAAQHRARFNPMAMLTLSSPTIIEDAALIGDALVIAAGKDPHWDESARNFIEGIILHVATAAAHEGERTLVTVRRLLNSALKWIGEEDSGDFELRASMLANADWLDQVCGYGDIGDAIAGATHDFFDKSENERSSVLSTARRHTRILDYAAMRSVLSGHDFDLADLKRRAVTVYLCLPASRMALCNRWLRIFINQLLDAMEREKTVPAAPVLVCLDEFPVLGHMSQLENAAGQIASFDVKLWVILQDWGQGTTLYKERWESFAANAGIMQFFGNNDVATTEYISKRLGKTRIAAIRGGEVGKDQAQQGLTGKSETLEIHDLMAPEEITRHFARSDPLKRQLVIWAGKHPMILQRVEYFDRTGPFARPSGEFDSLGLCPFAFLDGKQAGESGVFTKEIGAFGRQSATGIADQVVALAGFYQHADDIFCTARGGDVQDRILIPYARAVYIKPGLQAGEHGHGITAFSRPVGQMFV